MIEYIYEMVRCITGQSRRYSIQLIRIPERENGGKKIREEIIKYTNAEGRHKFTVRKSPPSVKRNG